MGCCASSASEVGHPSRRKDTFDNPLVYFIHTDPALEDAVAGGGSSSPTSPRRNVLDRPIVRASRQLRRDNNNLSTHMSPSTETDFVANGAASASFLSGSAVTPNTLHGQRKLGRTLGSSGNSGWDSSYNLHFGSSHDEHACDYESEFDAQILQLDEEMNVLRGADSVGDLAEEPTEEALEKRCRKIVRRAVEHGINDDPEQFDTFPEPLSVLATSIRRSRKWLQTLPSYPRRFAGSNANASGTECHGSASTDVAQSGFLLIDPYAFSNIGSSMADRDVCPRREADTSVPNTPLYSAPASRDDEEQ
jgi:hypothetical protein